MARTTGIAWSRMTYSAVLKESQRHLARARRDVEVPGNRESVALELLLVSEGLSELWLRGHQGTLFGSAPVEAGPQGHWEPR